MSLAQVWAAIEAVVDRDHLRAAVGIVDELVPGDEDDEGAKRAELIKRFATVRLLACPGRDVAFWGRPRPAGRSWPPPGRSRSCSGEEGGRRRDR